MRKPREGAQQHPLYPQPFSEAGHPRLTWWYRFLLGRPMDGIRWTDATFWRSATQGEDHWWLRLAGWHRALIRLLTGYLLIVLTPVSAVLTLTGRYGSLAQLLTAHLIALTPWLLLTEWRQQRKHGVWLPMLEEIEREDGTPGRQLMRVCVREGWASWEYDLVRPVALVAAEVLDVGWHPEQASEWVHIPRDYAQPGGGSVEIDLPSKFTASEQKRKALLAAIKPRLGLMELEASWQLKGRHPRLELTAPPAPPSIAPYAAYRDLLMRSDEYRPFLGVAASGELLAAEMQGDSPHTALSAGSGAGKSKLTASIVAQVLSWGWHVIILDWKVESHEWAKGLPGVTYVSEVSAIHDTCVRIGQEVDVRRMLTPDERAQRSRTLVVREEWNITAEQLTLYWAELRAQEMRLPPDEREFMPPRSPAITAMSKLDGAGRAFNLFDFLIAQRMSNRVFNGNTDARESFGLRLLARYTMQTWKMLTALKYIKKPSQIGRWVAVVNDEAQQFQAILGTDEEWRELAMSGQPNPTSAFAIDPHRSDRLSANGNDSHVLRPQEAAESDIDLALGDQRPAEATRGRQIEASVMLKLVDLSSRLDYLGVTKKILENWRDEKDSGFPAHVGGSPNSGFLYDLNEVTAYARNRRAAEAARRGARK